MPLLSLKYANFWTEIRSILGLKYPKNPDKDRGGTGLQASQGDMQLLNGSSTEESFEVHAEQGGVAGLQRFVKLMRLASIFSTDDNKLVACWVPDGDGMVAIHLIGYMDQQRVDADMALGEKPVYRIADNNWPGDQPERQLVPLSQSTTSSGDHPHCHQTSSRRSGSRSSTMYMQGTGQDKPKEGIHAMEAAWEDKDNTW
ncbi:hypothetical protein FIBSPDRAFT_887021 [Athelia psychrophila]|uniref:Uncharacterized protein n=1 Tax=Athelia psychrophila TaxID=1759441 RepID=A0A166Q6S0_9AGAM|nr:hypothetical protein FIBSPDRAFT_887021 [Fibularhizoctonia sp. CBS 109695]